jgi:HAE1 family hydrophobic/amphiphilic exporter-1
MRAPMARAVIGGLVTSTLLTLVVVPVVYTYLDGLRPEAVKEWFNVWRRRRASVSSPEAGPQEAPLPVPD